MGTLNFHIFQFHPDVLRNVRGSGFTKPSAFQSDVIPLIMQGKDVIGISTTGTGRTAAFVLPMLHRLIRGEPGSTRALVLLPTAEAAERTSAVTDRLANDTGLKSIALYGKAATEKQQTTLRRGTDIIIGCPGSVLNGLWKGMINLSSLEICVIDEADGMAAEGLLPDIFNILMCVTLKRQTLLFSTTLPENIKKLSRQFLHQPVTVIDQPGTAVRPAAKTAPDAPPPPAAPPKMNTALLRETLGKAGNNAVLVFTRTDNNAGRALKMIQKAGYQVNALRGRLLNMGKTGAARGFPAGPVIILIITHHAPGSLDVAGIFRIVNSANPENTGGAQHIGRGGRLDKNGNAFTLVTNADSMILHVLEKCLAAPLEQVTL